MKRIYLTILAVTTVSVITSLTVTSIISYAILQRDTYVDLVICSIVPIFVAAPVTWYIDRQRRKLDMALSDLRRAHEQLEYQANRDFLTGALNRQCFVKTVSEGWGTEGGALLCMDVDNFKQINDTYGHGVGDMALKLITDAITAAVGEGDLVARIGGEEFSVFSFGAGYDEAEALGERIRRIISELVFRPDGEGLHKLTVSIGVAFTSETGRFDALVDLADQRMYRAKTSGEEPRGSAGAIRRAAGRLIRSDFGCLPRLQKRVMQGNDGRGC
ncbi:GGDEF domain-containing protein [uncultured Cohaesibacter sp.]|uniref:GGDEF domain-containing protein n=1 Tax=uncultured Cohaesibacter sp. TaxID=1002546 RepID=UPI0029C6F83F|nr:GGDEF domain-containing protein [uncultured Cohaesibacter sp.]